MGANAEVVEQAVAQLIEQQVNGAEGMLYMELPLHRPTAPIPSTSPSAWSATPTWPR
jgi:hypothetical protein